MPLMSFGDQELQDPCEFIEMVVPLVIAAISMLLLSVLYLHTCYYMYLYCLAIDK